ncbi:MAG: hypothetical protein ACPLTR_12225 [Thermacetogeniaceae bacterium]
MAVCINPCSLLASIGVEPEKTWIDFDENIVFLFQEEWERVSRYFGWSSLAEAGEYGGWRFEKIPCPEKTKKEAV